VNRRNFLQSMIGGLAASAAVRQWPFRVYSFPTDIVLPNPAWEPDLMIMSRPTYDALFAAMNKIPINWEAAKRRDAARGGHRHGRWSPLYAPEYRS